MTTPSDHLAGLNKGQREVVKHLLEIGTEDWTEVHYATIVYKGVFAGDLDRARRAAVQIVRRLVDVGYIELSWDDRSFANRRGAEVLTREQASEALELENEFVIPPQGAPHVRRLGYSATDEGKRY